ncbi:unnamed protein product [Medioppia subpectinata]|uniref:CCDC92/74 N-terminal domain-containing protein n=1 Tax=Medioppia subpectinata TaxID=1979941 RepID=A0A7R9Q3B4_9ACAR|nr:unnamed protein product [Medioppia subpectinata]CAG2110377.1 unnamed protein product [Medioppia subpectinata]
MESASNVFNSHPLPHQQFTSRIAFAKESNVDHTLSQIRFKSLSNKKITTRLPPIARFDSPGNRRQSLTNSYSQSMDSIDGSYELNDNHMNTGLDENMRIKQLEANIKFVKEDCQHILESLHHELEELRIQNRDLQYELIMKGSLSPQMPHSLAKEDMILMPFIRGKCIEFLI